LIADVSILHNFEDLYRIAPEKLQELSRALSLFKVPAREGKLITGEGANQAYLILRGAVKVGYVSPFLSTILAPGQISGLCDLTPEGPRLMRYGAITDSVIGRIEPRSFVDTLFGVPLRSFQLMAKFVLGNWWAGSVARHSAVGRLPLLPRLSRTLLAIGAKFGVEDSRGMLLNLPLTQKDLADLIGSSRPQVSLQLAKLSGCGALIRDGRRLILVKPRLEEEAFKTLA
jgi:CRP-like cAMP-binding protein